MKNNIRINRRFLSGDPSGGRQPQEYANLGHLTKGVFLLPHERSIMKPRKVYVSPLSYRGKIEKHMSEIEKHNPDLECPPNICTERDRKTCAAFKQRECDIPIG